MQVLVAEHCGFCLGVKNAIRLAEQTLDEAKAVYSLGPIIHNDDVVARLARAGLKTVADVEQIPAGATVLIRSHGASLQQLDQIRRRGLQVIDATCVLVKRVRRIVQNLQQKGYRAVIIGDKHHPEVQALVGSAKGVIVVTNGRDVRNLAGCKKLGIVCQTTQSPDHFAKMVGRIAGAGFEQLKVVNTLCKEAIKRQSSAVQLCKRVDIMFVLGGLHSSNTRKLAELCRRHNCWTFHLQNLKELDRSLLSGKKVAGVTAGASTPDEIIIEFVENLRALEPPG
jgi:4-hydroxy-3-methylbut-2-enyl diphosphate reductase